MTLGDVIAEYRKQTGMSMERFAVSANMSKGYVSILEKNKTQRGDEPSPSFEKYRDVAKAIGMDVDELIRKVDGKVSFQPSRPLPSNVVPIPQTSKVPLVGQIACGAPILAEENITDYVDLPGHIRADYALTCKGDSMINAGIRDGDIVYIRQQEEVENGQIAAVLVDEDEATLKRFYFDGSMIQLVAENPRIPPLVYTGDNASRVRVIGLAVAYTHIIE